MSKQPLSAGNASLNLMKTGEQGVVTHFKSSDETIVNKLTAMGMIPGTKITLEHRFPSFIIKMGNTRLAFDEMIARSICVRITGH